MSANGNVRTIFPEYHKDQVDVFLREGREVYMRRTRFTQMGFLQIYVYLTELMSLSKPALVRARSRARAHARAWQHLDLLLDIL